MAIREIIEKGDPLLRKRSREVDSFNERLHTLLSDMAETLRIANGVGLAAPQVGVLRRAVIVDNGTEYMELINPEITAVEGEQIGLEGCLSVPGKYGIVERPNKVAVKYQDRNGEWHEYTGEELTARAICHELEHLEGILFIDKASRMLSDEELAELEQSEGDS